jgi:hypothetical protein
MRVREAKDFLVQETAKQATIEGVPLSELEKRMMYFTESGYVPEDPIALNEEFEAKYDTEEYEAKVAKLLQHAYERAGKENDATRKQFDSAIKCLRRGDHYLLVMWDSGAGSRSGSLVGFGSHSEILTGFGIGFLVLAAFYAIKWFAGRVAPPNPRVIQAVLALLILCCVFFPRAVGKAFGWILKNTFERFGNRNESESD